MYMRTTCPRFISDSEAQIQVAAYPGKPLTGRVSDIGPVLDPTIRTAKVRIEVANPGMLRLGMFVTATLLSRSVGDSRPSCRPAPFCTFTIANGSLCPQAREQFKRVEVSAGDMLPGSSSRRFYPAWHPASQLVNDVLNLEATVEAQ